jgi:FKBP-type peptidyl-prolyl cis-trans isomerase FkpA
MRKALKLSVVAAAISLISACGNAEQKNEPVKLESDADKQSYALGASMGRYLKTNLDKNAEIGIELSQEMIIGGIQDALGGKVQLEDDELKTVMAALETEVRKRRTAKQKELATAAKASGEAFLTENAKKAGVVVTESGLQYEVITSAEGDKPAAEDTVTVHYHGTLTDGTVFDSSVERGQTTSFALNRVIPGWTEGLQYMSKGSKYKFYIPSNLAYGERSAGKIPPNSTLIFEVELFDIEKANKG